MEDASRETKPLNFNKFLVPTECDFNVPLELLIVNQKLGVELHCPVCLQILREPRQCVNGHSSCLACLTQLDNAQNTVNRCPVCRCKMIEKGRNLFLEWQLNNLTIWCKYHFQKGADQEFVVDVHGCNKKLEMSVVKVHERNCAFAPISCPYSKSCGIMKRQELSGHIDVCEYRPIRCENCHSYIQYKDLEKHRLSCEKALVDCQFCSETIKRFELGQHLRFNCPKNPRECPYRPYGCTSEVMVSEDLESHLQHTVNEHLQQICASFETKISELENRFQKLLLEKDEQIEELKKSTRLDKLRLCWNLPWSSVKKRYYISSDIFLVRGFQFYLGIFPRGDPEVDNSKEYVSLYLFINMKKNSVNRCDAAKSIFLDWIFRIVNKNNELAMAKKFKSWFPVKDGEGWGEARLIETNKITKANGFLSDSGILQIECDIQVIQKLLEI